MRRSASLIVAISVLHLFIVEKTIAGTIVNIDAKVSGYDGLSTFPPQPVIGDTLIPFQPMQVTLGPGTYTITNASSAAGVLPGATASFQGWRFDSGSADWAWVFVMADASTNKIIGGGDEDPNNHNSPFPSQQAAASDPAVENFMTTLTLSTTTTVDFMIRDFSAGLSDNAGGISLDIEGGGSRPRTR